MKPSSPRRIAKRPKRAPKLPDKKPLIPINYEAAKALYNTPDYREWREYVLHRDKYICQMCGKGGQLEVHHIRRKVDRPDLTLSRSNGITLCVYCHQQIVTGSERRFEYIFSRIVKENETRNTDGDLSNKEYKVQQSLRGELLPYSEAMDKARTRP